MSRALDKRNEQIRALASKGVPREKIAERFGVTRVRVSQIVTGSATRSQQARNRALARLVAKHRKELQRYHAEEMGR